MVPYRNVQLRSYSQQRLPFVDSHSRGPQLECSAARGRYLCCCPRRSTDHLHHLSIYGFPSTPLAGEWPTLPRWIPT